MVDTREDMQHLLAQCRDLVEVPEPLFRLLELIVARFESPFTITEVPTRPEHRKTPPPMQRVSPTPFEKVTLILDGKDPKKR